MPETVNVILFGATGMVGEGALLEALEEPRVAGVLAVGRRSPGRSHPKLREALRTDFHRYDDARDLFAGYQACFFCLGVSSLRMSEEEYTRLTYDITLAAARTLADVNPGMTFCYVSGEGTDSSARGRVMWARVKGRTENDLLAMENLDAYMLRPGYIHPTDDIRSRYRSYRVAHAVLRPLFPAIRRVFGSHVTTTRNIGRALIALALDGYAKRVLENDDINALAGDA